MRRVHRILRCFLKSLKWVRSELSILRARPNSITGRMYNNIIRTLDDRYYTVVRDVAVEKRSAILLLREKRRKITITNEYNETEWTNDVYTLYFSSSAGPPSNKEAVARAAAFGRKPTAFRLRNKWTEPSAAANEYLFYFFRARTHTRASNIASRTRLRSARHVVYVRRRRKRKKIQVFTRVYYACSFVVANLFSLFFLNDVSGYSNIDWRPYRYRIENRSTPPP